MLCGEIISTQFLAKTAKDTHLPIITIIQQRQVEEEGNLKKKGAFAFEIKLEYIHRQTSTTA